MHALHKLMFIHLLTCLRQNALGSEIINGELAPENDLLYMASVQNYKGHICGGALVTEDFVLTAAHCDRMDLTSVVLGTHNLRNHQKILSTKVLPSKTVQFIQLPSSEMTLKENEKCRVAGWGKMETSVTNVGDLRVVDVSVISPQVCRKLWPGLAPSVICAGGYKTRKGSCQGDSGGPLVCRGKAVGVFNNQRNCDYPDRPNVYADISADLTWIKKILEEKDC